MDRRKAYHQAAILLRLFFTGLIPAAAPILGASPAHAATPATVGGPFSLTAPDGTTVTDRSFRGKWMLVFFGYTSCPVTCPTTLSEIAVALDVLGPEAERVQPVFITVDPERDTPAVMGQYTGAIDRRIVGLTGSSEQIGAASEAYGAYSAMHRTGTAHRTMSSTTAPTFTSWTHMANSCGVWRPARPAKRSPRHLRGLMRQPGE